MKTLLTITALLATTAVSAGTPDRAYPSCDFPTQHTLKGEAISGSKDAGQAHISMRANILQADIGSARKAGRVSQIQAGDLWKQVEAIRSHIGTFVLKQGFLSAAERATYDRQLDAIAQPICRAGGPEK